MKLISNAINQDPHLGHKSVAINFVYLQLCRVQNEDYKDACKSY